MHDFTTCYYKVVGRPGTECFGGAEGFKELRDYVESMSDPAAAGVTLVINGLDGVMHDAQVRAAATLHNRGVGSSLVFLTTLFNGRQISDAITATIITPDIISSSTGGCIGRHDPLNTLRNTCFDETLFDDPDEPIVILGVGNDGSRDALNFMLTAGISSLFLQTEVDKGHWLWVYGLNREGDDRHPDSSTCHEIIKDYCIGAPLDVVAGGGNFDSDGIYTGPGINQGTSFSVPIVAVALKLLKEADPTIANTRLIEIACASATDLGDPGNDAIYGCGALNLVGLFDQFGAFVGAAAFPGISPARVFNSAPVDPTTGFVNNDLLSNAGANSQNSPFSLDGNMGDSASFCVGILCTFYDAEMESLQTGIASNGEWGFASLLYQRDDDFFGGKGTSGSRSDFGDVDYLKGTIGWETNIYGSLDLVSRFDIAKGSAEAPGGRIDNLGGTLTKASFELNREFSPRTNLSFYASHSNFGGEAGISGSKHNLNHDGFEFGVNFLHRF